VIENVAELINVMQNQVYYFVPDTVTEVAAAVLVDFFDQTCDLTLAMRKPCKLFDEAFTLLAMHADQPEQIVAARRDLPLVIGLGEGENFLSSDVSGFIDYTKKAVEMDNDHIVTVTADEGLIN